MRKLTCFALLALAAAVLPARAQVLVQTPWACIRVGPPTPTRVVVQTPWVTVGVGPSFQSVQQQAVPISFEPRFTPGEPPPVPLPIPVETAPPRAPTLTAFAATFKPAAGRYEVVVEHPATGQPVKVGFSLPEGTPKRVKVHRRELDFEYQGKVVSIRFMRDGEVRVRD
jgi:hypothetical protein